MNETLLEVLRSHENEIIWVLVPGGLLSGKLEIPEQDIITLHAATYYAGSARLAVSAADVLIEQISAYGLGAPVLARPN